MSRNKTKRKIPTVFSTMYKIKVLEKNEGEDSGVKFTKNNEHERFDSTLDRQSPTLPEFSVSIIVYRRFQKNLELFFLNGNRSSNEK